MMPISLTATIDMKENISSPAFVNEPLKIKQLGRKH